MIQDTRLAAMVRLGAMATCVAFVMGTLLPVLIFAQAHALGPLWFAGMIVACANSGYGAAFCTAHALLFLVPAMLSFGAFLWSLTAVARRWYARAVGGAAVACGLSWLWMSRLH